MQVTTGQTLTLPFYAGVDGAGACFGAERHHYARMRDVSIWSSTGSAGRVCAKRRPRKLTSSERSDQSLHKAVDVSVCDKSLRRSSWQVGALQDVKMSNLTAMP